MRTLRWMTLTAGAIAFNRLLDRALEDMMRAPDATSRMPFALPPGDDIYVQTRDGADIHIKNCLPAAGAEDASLAPIVLVHGWATDMRSWGTIARELVAAGHSVHLVDNRAHGLSTTGHEGVTIEAMSRDLTEVLENLGIDGCVIAGHSLGSTIMQHWLIENCSEDTNPPDGRVPPAHSRVSSVGDRVSAVALLSNGATDKRQDPRLVALGNFLASSTVLERIFSLPRFGVVAMGMMAETNAHLVHIRQLRDHQREVDPAVRKSTILFTLQDFSEQLGSVRKPVKVVVGEKDRFAPAATVRRLAGYIPGSEFVSIAGAGHILAINAPQEVSSLLHRMAREHRATGRRPE